jgi:LEA14-like dessication related protein
MQGEIPPTFLGGRKMRIIGIALCLLCAMCAGCGLLKGLRKPTAKITGIHLQKLSLDKVDLVVDVNVHNPYSFDLPLANVDYTMSSGGTQFLSGSADLQNTAIPSRGSKMVPVPVELPFLNLLKVVMGIKPGKVISYEADVKLWVNVPGLGPLGIPLKWSDKVPIPALPVIELAGIKWEKLKLDEVRGVLNLRLRNVNEFPLDLERISYGLKLSDAEIVKTESGKAVSLAPGEEGTVEIPLSFDPKKLGMAVLEMLSGQKANYELGGALDFGTPYGKINMPFTQKGETTFTRP